MLCRNPFREITPREFAVLRLLLAENTTEEVAETLHVSPKTVANLHSLIKDNLGVGSDTQLDLGEA